MFYKKALSKEKCPSIWLKSTFLGGGFSGFVLVFCANSRRFVQKGALQRLKTLENTRKTLKSVKEACENMCLLREFF